MIEMIAITLAGVIGGLVCLAVLAMAVDALLYFTAPWRQDLMRRD